MILECKKLNFIIKFVAIVRNLKLYNFAHVSLSSNSNMYISIRKLSIILPQLL